MVVFDATILMLMLRPNSGRPLDFSGQPITQVSERIAHLVQSLEKSRTRIIVPTPALSEVLVRSGAAGPGIVETLGRSAVFRIAPFDSLAAIEAALMTRTAIDTGDKRGGSEATWAKVKFDRQIVAIAKVTQANAIYSDDADVRTIAAAEGIAVIGLAELPLPLQNPQIEMQLEPPAVQEGQPDASSIDETDEDETDGDHPEPEEAPEQPG
jgi:monoamine oxidase